MICIDVLPVFLDTFDDMYWCTLCISRHFWWYVLIYSLYFETFLNELSCNMVNYVYFLSVICKLGLGLSQVEHVCILSATQVRNLSVFQTRALVLKTDRFLACVEDRVQTCSLLRPSPRCFSPKHKNSLTKCFPIGLGTGESRTSVRNTNFSQTHTILLQNTQISVMGPWVFAGVRNSRLFTKKHWLT